MKITGITIGFIIMYAWLLLPKGVMIEPFPFDPQVISLQAYADYLFTRVLLFIFALSLYYDNPTIENKIISQMFFLYVVDYILIYNNPICYISNILTRTQPLTGFYIPVSYYLVMGIVLIWLSIKEQLHGISRMVN